jgi:predicted nucleotide-binding protein
MSKVTTESTDSNNTNKKRLSQSDLPGVSVNEALRIALAIRDNYAMSPATPLDIGKAIGIAPTTGKFRTLTGASIAYGLTTGGYNATEIALTDLGRRIVMPQEEGDDSKARLEAFERPRIIKEFIAKYNGNKLPPKDIARNVLFGMGVPHDTTERAYSLLEAGMKQFGYLSEINGSGFIQRPKGSAPSPSVTSAAEDDLVANDEKETPQTVTLPPETPPAIPTPLKPSAIFLGHGKNKKPLEQLIKLLDELGVPHKEATAEANAGRPIPVKVADTMKECGAAILIFTADEEFKNSEGDTIWRPSENVVHELGAASVLYDNRIIVFKEESINLASNFSSIGYISFETDRLQDKTMELFRELVKFKLISLKVGE